MTSDDIGKRGEAIFVLLITQLSGRRAFFRPHYLGDKFPTLDFLVELNDPSQGKPYFFVQVKTTARDPLCKKGSPWALPAKVSQRDVLRLTSYPAPTYVVGIEEKAARGFIVSLAASRNAGLAAIPMQFPLNRANLQLLWNEVHEFWKSRDMTLRHSRFSVPG